MKFSVLQMISAKFLMHRWHNIRLRQKERANITVKTACQRWKLGHGLSRARRRKAKPEEEEGVRQLLAVCAREKRKGDKGSANECRAELAQAMPKYRANERRASSLLECYPECSRYSTKLNAADIQRLEPLYKGWL